MQIFCRGFRFDPSPQEAVTYYLPRLIAGAPLHDAVRPVVHRAEVYGSEPSDLARRFGCVPKTTHRFFFTSYKKRVRAAGPAGSWISQSTAPIIKDDDGAEVKIGEVRKFRYKKSGVFTDWLMDEFSCCCLEEAVVGDKQLVLCKMYVSPRAGPDSAARQESAAFFVAPAVPAPAAFITPNIFAVPAPKRPAPQVAMPPCPKRVRVALPATIAPAVVQQPPGCATSSSAPRPCAPTCGMPTSSTPLVTWTSPSPAPAHPPAPPVQNRPAVQPGRSQAPAPPRPLAPTTGCCTTASISAPRACAPKHLPVHPGRSPVPAPPQPPLAQPKQEMPLPPASRMVRAGRMPRTTSASDPPSKELPATIQDDDDDDFAKSIEDALEVEEMLPTDEAEDNDDHFAKSIEDALEVEEMLPTDEAELSKSRNPFEAAWAREQGLTFA